MHSVNERSWCEYYLSLFLAAWSVTMANGDSAPDILLQPLTCVLLNHIYIQTLQKRCTSRKQLLCLMDAVLWWDTEIAYYHTWGTYAGHVCKGDQWGSFLPQDLDVFIPFCGESCWGSGFADWGLLVSAWIGQRCYPGPQYVEPTTVLRMDLPLVTLKNFGTLEQQAQSPSCGTDGPRFWKQD